MKPRDRDRDRGHTKTSVRVSSPADWWAAEDILKQLRCTRRQRRRHVLSRPSVGWLFLKKIEAVPSMV